ncbi:hypothetical protein ACIF6L_34655 [Kitasatospora sp. NPDC086009]|uniref:hypothetical protein n=1 Tax=unclassified Kitasatospora TaxID=2633591 RepID=UPI0037CA797B
MTDEDSGEQRPDARPKIRLHKFEFAMAIQWPTAPWPGGLDRWLVTWGSPDASSEWREEKEMRFDRLGPDDEWMDPLADHHKDLTPWTSAIRRDLRSIVQILNRLDDHPFG